MRMCGADDALGLACALPVGHDGSHSADGGGPYKMGDVAIVLLHGRGFWHRVTDPSGRVPDFPGSGWTMVALPNEGQP